MTKVNCIYKYVYNDEIIYIGKSDSSLIARVDGHAKEPKFQPYLKDCKIFYFKTVNPAETKVFETCLIDKYKPILNVVDKYKEGTGRFTVEEPEWKPYRREDFREEKVPKKKSSTQKETKDKGYCSFFKCYYRDMPLVNSLLDLEPFVADSLDKRDNDIKKMFALIFEQMTSEDNEKSKYVFNDSYLIEEFNLGKQCEDFCISTLGDFVTKIHSQRFTPYQEPNGMCTDLRAISCVTHKTLKKKIYIELDDEFFSIIQSNLKRYKTWASEILKNNT